MLELKSPDTSTKLNRHEITFKFLHIPSYCDHCAQKVEGTAVSCKSIKKIQSIFYISM